MRFSRLAVTAALCSPLVAAFSPGLNNYRQKAVFPPKKRENNNNKPAVVGPLNVGEEVTELARIVDLSSVFLLLAPAAALSAALVAQAQKGKLAEKVESTEEDLEKIRNQIKSAESAISASTAVTIASAGFVAANVLGLLPNSLAPDVTETSVASIATPQETVVEKASSEEGEGVFADDDAVVEEKASAVVEEKEKQVEEKTSDVPDMGGTEQIPAASSEQTKQRSNFFGLPAFNSAEPKTKAPVAEATVDESKASDTSVTSVEEATAATVESTTAAEEKAPTAEEFDVTSVEPTSADEEKVTEPTAAGVEQVPATAEKVPAASAEPIAEDKPDVPDAVDGASIPPPAAETPKESVSVFEDLMKKMEMAGKAGIDGVETGNEKPVDEPDVPDSVDSTSGQPSVVVEEKQPAVDDASTPPAAAETPKESVGVFENLMKKMEMAGEAGTDGVETGNEKPGDEIVTAKPVESVEKVTKPEDTSAETAKSPDSVFDDLMKKMELAGKAGTESVEAAKERVAEAIENAADALSGGGDDVGTAVKEAAEESEEATVAAGAVALTDLKMQFRTPEFFPDLENIDPVVAQGAAVLTFGAIAAAAVIAASDSGGTGSTFSPGTKSKGTGYLDGLTRSSTTLASKGTKGPTSYLDTLKTPSSSMSSARTGAGAGASYLDVLSPRASAAKKSYSYSGKKPIKTGSSESPVKTLAPSGSYKAAPASPSLSQPLPPKSSAPSPSTAATVQPLLLDKRAEPPAVAPLATSSQSSGSSAPEKSFSPYGNKPKGAVGAGSMGASSSYLSNVSTSGATFVSPSVEPSWSPAPVAAPAATSTVTTSEASRAASYSPFGNKPKSTGATGAMGSSSSYLSGMNAANGAGVSFSSAPPASYTDTLQEAPKASYSPFGGGAKPKSTGNAGAMGSSSSYLSGMGTNGEWQSQPAYSPPPPSPSPPSAEPVSQSYAASLSKSYAPMQGKPKAVARGGTGSYLDAL